MNTYYKQGDWIGKFLKKQRTQNVLKHLNGNLLDIACGENDLVKQHGQGVGVDIKDFGADHVVEHYYQLPFNDQEFDTVAIIASINYFENPERVLSEVHRLLKDDGTLVITNSNYRVMQVWHLFRESWAHKAGYSKKHLTHMLTNTGFKVDKTQFFNLFQSYVMCAKKEL